MTEPSLFDHDPPTHAADPYPSRQAAARARPRARTQAQRILIILTNAGPDGASTRTIQRHLCPAGPADPAWNKVPTRLLELQRKGLAARFGTTEPDENGQHFLVYTATPDGQTAAADLMVEDIIHRAAMR